MGETIELTDMVLRVIGAFYAFGGFVATRAGLMSQFLDQAIAAIALKKPPRSETAQNAWLIATAALVLIGGVLLLAGLQLAAWVFVASSLGQAAYIYYVAPRFFDRRRRPDATVAAARTNAFVIYLGGDGVHPLGRISRTAPHARQVLDAGARRRRRRAAALCRLRRARAVVVAAQGQSASAGGLLGAMPDDDARRGRCTSRSASR